MSFAPALKKRAATLAAAAALVLLLQAVPAAAGEAEEAYQSGLACKAMYRLALVEWERVFHIVVPDVDALLTTVLAEDSRDKLKGVRAEFCYFGGVCAFHTAQTQRDPSRYRLAGRRMALAQRLGETAGDSSIVKEAGLWAAACEAAARPQMDVQAVQRIAADASGGSAVTVAYILSYLRDAAPADTADTLDPIIKQLYIKVASLAEKPKEKPATPDAPAHQFQATLARLTRRRLGWLRFRIEKNAAGYLPCIHAYPDFVPESGPGPPAAEARKHEQGLGSLLRRSEIALWDVARLREVAQIYFASARAFAPEDSEAHVAAAIQLGDYTAARSLARRAAASARAGGDVAERLHAQAMRILKAQADYRLGRTDSLDQVRRRLANPGFAEEQKDVYYRVANRLAEALMEIALSEHARRKRLAEALAVARSAVQSLEKNYKAIWPPARITEYYEQTRSIYATLAHLHFLLDKPKESFDVYGLVYPWHRRAWLAALRADPVFCVRYSALLFARNNFALARELAYNYEDYGLVAVFPDAALLHSASSTLEYLLRPTGRRKNEE